MYEQRLPIEEWKFQKQKERNDTIAAQKKYCRKLCRMASALPTICTAGGGLVVISHPAMQHLCCKPCRKRGPY